MKKNKEIKNRFTVLLKLSKIVNLMEYSIHTELSTINFEKIELAKLNFEAIYKDDFCPLFKGEFSKVFLYKLDYETNFEIFVYCLKICKNLSRNLYNESFEVDLVTSLKAQTLENNFNTLLNDYV
jgi:hypothetical protein